MIALAAHEPELPRTCFRCATDMNDGLCHACLVLCADDEVREWIGDYGVLSELDSGGSCTVHIARHREHEGLFALKLAKPALVRTPEGAAAYRSGLRIQRRLGNEPNILPVEEIGTHADGRPYAVMSLRTGGTLADPEVRARYSDPYAALSLMIKLSGAVARAHQRMVLHADLKPENILFDEDGEPFISDFGLARVLDCKRTRGGPAFQGGTPGWMSPEQADRQSLALASDVFSLGTLLYWLFSGEQPFGSDLSFERRVREREPPPLRTRYCGPYAWELEQICQRALEKNPEQRYPSAIELAEELRRLEANRTIAAEQGRLTRKLWKWSQRRRSEALALIMFVLLLLYLPATPFLGRAALEQAMRAQIGFSALAQAGAVMNELRAIGHRVERAALDPELRRLLQHRDPRQSPLSMEPLAKGLDGLSLFSAQGVLKARWPRNRGADMHRFDFGFRDYYQGQQKFAREGMAELYVARPFHSASDGEPLVGLSTAVYDQGHYVGVLLGATRARDTFGAVRMECGDPKHCMSALLGPRDRDHAGQALPDSLFVLAAPGMKLGQEVMVAPPLARRICAQLDCEPQAREQFESPLRRRPLVVEHYEDPVTHVPSLAALAPVGRTGLIVVVATPHDAFSAIGWQMFGPIVTHLWLPFGIGGTLFLILLVAQRLTGRTARRSKSSRRGSLEQ